MLSRKSSALKAFWVAVFLVFLAGCQEGPLGFDELGRGELVIEEIVLEADTVGFFSEQVSLGEAVTLIGGRDSLTEARVLLSVDGLDSIGAFDSVKLVLRRYPEEEMAQSNVTFKAYPVTTEWDEKGCTWVKKDEYTKWRTLGGELDTADLVTQFTIDKDRIELRLDSARVEDYRQGIILIPQSEGFAYLGSMEGRDSLRASILGFEEDDTTKFSAAAGSDYYADIHDATILKPYEAPSADTLIGAGLAWRTFIHFSLDTLPREIDITSAALVVGYENFFSPETSLDFVCYRLVGPYEGRFSNLSQSIGGRDSIPGEADSFSISFAGLMQFWVDEPDSNFGIVVSHSFLPYNPSFGQEKRIYALGRVVGRPKLVVTYTYPPLGRFPGKEE